MSETTTSLIQTFDFEERAFRAVLRDGNPWFIASDVAAVTKIANIRKRMEALDADEKADVALSYSSSNGVEQRRTVSIISESGLYTLMLRCDDAIKPGTTAHKFRKWVTSEVLPALRKEGAYSLARAAARDKAAARFDRLRRDLVERVRHVESRAGSVADGVLNGGKLPMSRVRAVHSLGRLQLDAIRLLLDLEATGSPSRLNANGTAVLITEDDLRPDDEDD